LINTIGQCFAIIVARADDNPGMRCNLEVQANEMAPVVGDDRPGLSGGESQNGGIGDFLPALASLLNG
jgi:hypothetical protein